MYSLHDLETRLAPYYRRHDTKLIAILPVEGAETAPAIDLTLTEAGELHLDLFAGRGKEEPFATYLTTDHREAVALALACGNDQLTRLGNQPLSGKEGGFSFEGTQIHNPWATEQFGEWCFAPGTRTLCDPRDAYGEAFDEWLHSLAGPNPEGRKAQVASNRTHKSRIALRSAEATLTFHVGEDDTDEAIRAALADLLGHKVEPSVFQTDTDGYTGLRFCAALITGSPAEILAALQNAASSSTPDQSAK